jgi:glutathione S-transferase
LLDEYPRLAAWWAKVSPRASFAATDPGLPPSDRVTKA